MQEKILVTGGAGFIGTHTVIELVQAGHQVVVVDNLVNSSRKSLEVVERITGVDSPTAFKPAKWMTPVGSSCLKISRSVSVSRISAS